MSDGIIMELVRSGGVSGTIVACALIYLAQRVRGLQQSLDRALPALEDHGQRIATLEERTKNA